VGGRKGALLSLGTFRALSSSSQRFSANLVKGQRFVTQMSLALHRGGGERGGGGGGGRWGGGGRGGEGGGGGRGGKQVRVRGGVGIEVKRPAK